jgi:Rps23 Pro-64 3,4-dihydroxylase Tpa1-like proline 4-hydroxylase
MTAKQILDSFSQTLIQDEQILSPQERQLLISLLQNAKEPSSNPEIQSAVAATIARSVGETVAQRAFTLLGSSIVEQILAGATNVTVGQEIEPISATPKTPRPPSAPRPPKQTPDEDLPVSPKPPQPPGERPDDAPNVPGPPGTGLQLPVWQTERSHLNRGIGVLDAPAIVRARSVVLDEFLVPQELNELISYALQHETDFQNSEVISPNVNMGVVEYDHRRSRVLMDLGKHQDVILQRIRGVLPGVLEQLGMDEFPVTHVETQLTASNDGDFFCPHSDSSHEKVVSRTLTFVYFFHREARPFEGGELLLHDSYGDCQTGNYQTIVPQQNQVVFFPCSALHEITPVVCPSKAFADSRFTLNGWLHK